jgi:hypothetical protein
MDQAKANQYAVQLGFTPQQVQSLQALPTFEAATQALEEMKNDARSRYRKLVFQNHPDRNPGDTTAMATLRDLNEVMKQIESLKIERRAPQPVMQIHFVHVQQPMQAQVRTAPHYNASPTSTTTSTYYAGRVAFVRPV